jgi:hypothetical protein
MSPPILSNRESFDNHDLGLCSPWCSQKATTVKRLSGIKRVVELLQAACERYRTKLTFASDVSKVIIQVADAEVNRKDQLRSNWKLIMTALNGINVVNDDDDDTNISSI